MPDVVTIPATEDEAKRDLKALGRLIRAKQWERAAIVAANVRLPGSGAHNRNSRGRSFKTAGEFADMKVTGLAKEETVRIYVQCWLDANDGEYPTRGAEVTLPSIPFPRTRTGTDGYSSEEGADATVDRLIEQHGPERIAHAVAVRAPRAARAALADHDEQELERSGLAAAGRGMSSVSDRADANYRRREYRTDDADAQWVIEQVRNLQRRMIERSLRDPSDNADLVSALNGMIVVATGERDRLTGASTSWSETDRVLASELGIDLEGVAP